MSTFLFASPVFGPVHSRRLGLSLGVNLLPADGKLCTFDCLYCECGFNIDNRPKTPMPSRALVAERLEERIRALEAEGRPIDAITFAGNGEPTMHPEFPAIAADTEAIRDRLAPNAKLCVLTNATNLLKPEVAAALERFDLPMLKLDAMDPGWVKRVNRPQRPHDPAAVVAAMKRFGAKCVVQTMFLAGTADGVSVDNTTDDFVKPWLEAVKAILPPGLWYCFREGWGLREPGLDRLTADELTAGVPGAAPVLEALRAAGGSADLETLRAHF